MTQHKETTIVYKKAVEADAARILELLEVNDGDRENFSFDQFVVAKDDDVVIGCIRIKELVSGTLELASLVVDENYRGKGIGKKLVQEIIKQYKKRPVYLLCALENSDFYQKSGFNIVSNEILPADLLALYNRILKLPFAKDIKIVSMAR